MESKQADTRLDWLDAAKGLGILLVVLGHSFRHDMFDRSDLCAYIAYLIYSFHMPLYFVISGCTFGISYRAHLASPLRFLKRRTQSLLVPMISYTCGIYLCFFAAYQIPAIKQMLSAGSYPLYSFGRYLVTAFVEDNPYSIHLWYLWVLYLMIILAFFWMYVGKDSKSAPAGFAVFAFACFVSTFFVDYPDNYRRLMLYMIYFAFGILLSGKQMLLHRKSRAGIAAAAAGWAVLLVNAVVAAKRLRPNEDWAVILQQLALLAAVPPVILSILRLSVEISQWKPILRLGRSSYAIYLLHQPFSCAFLGLLLYSKLGLPIPVVLAACIGTSIALPVLTVGICRKVRPLGFLAKKLLNIA